MCRFGKERMVLLLKNKSFSRFLAGLLAALMALAVILPLTSCQKDPGSPTPTPSATPEPAKPASDQTIYSGGKTEFFVIRPDLATEAETNALSLLVSQLTTLGGARPSVRDDWTDPNRRPEATYEILIGNTNRPASAEVRAQLRTNDYAVTILDTKIVIFAFTEEKLTEAVQYFLSCITPKEGSEQSDLIFRAADQKIEKAVYETESVSLAGAELSSYRIVYRTGVGSTSAVAKELAQAFFDKYNYQLSVLPDSTEEADYEIVVGNVARGQTAVPLLRVNDYNIFWEGNRVFLHFGAGDGMSEQAVAAFLEKLDSLKTGETNKISASAENLNLSKKGDYPVERYTLNGIDISNYSIVYRASDANAKRLANRVRNLVEINSGYRLPLLTDTNNKLDNTKEIVIGKTNRTEKGQLAQDLADAVAGVGADGLLLCTGNDCVLAYGEDDGALLAAVNHLTKALTVPENSAETFAASVEKISGTYKFTDYKIITYNDGDNATTKMPKVLAILKEYQPDLIGLQEVAAFDKLTYLRGLPDYDFVWYAIDSSGYAAPILYRKDKFKLIDSGTQWLSDTPNVKYSKYSESDYIRSYIYALFEDLATGQQFVYINLHADYVPAANVKQINKLLELTQKFRDRGLPVFYTADWNMSIGSEGFKDIVASNLLPTYSYLENPKLDGTMVGSDATIDFCFVDAYHFTASEYKVIRDHKYSDTASDHYPVYSVIRMIY